MSQIATTIEQSKKLIELGLSADTADMYYYKENVFNNALATFNGALLVKGNSKPEVEYTIPAWSLSALIELMPSVTLDSSNDHHYRLHCMEKFTEWHKNIIDTVFEMVCYLLENKLIK